MFSFSNTKLQIIIEREQAGSGLGNQDKQPMLSVTEQEERADSRRCGVRGDSYHPLVGAGIRKSVFHLSVRRQANLLSCEEG